jgi:hypothetical protein
MQPERERFLFAPAERLTQAHCQRELWKTKAPRIRTDFTDFGFSSMKIRVNPWRS